MQIRKGSARSQHPIRGELVSERGVRGICELIRDGRDHGVVGNKHPAGDWLLQIRTRLIEDIRRLDKRITQAQRHMRA
jgi:hypothetical protein